MSHTMNGHPFWCPPARQKDYGFDPIETKSDTVSVSLAEAALLVRHAIKQGLIKPPDKAEVKAAKLGIRSVWATCQQCHGEFSRDKFSSEPRCQSCRLGRKICGECGIEFQPTQKKQRLCGNACRIAVARRAAGTRATPKITIQCAWCRQPFEKRIQDHYQQNCSRACGVQSMAAKRRKQK